MNITEQIALLACGECKKMDHESEVDFAERLCRVYADCHDAIIRTMDEKAAERANTSRMDIDSLISDQP